MIQDEARNIVSLRITFGFMKVKEEWSRFVTPMGYHAVFYIGIIVTLLVFIMKCLDMNDGMRICIVKCFKFHLVIPDHLDTLVGRLVEWTEPSWIVIENL